MALPRGLTRVTTESLFALGPAERPAVAGLGVDALANLSRLPRNSVAKVDPAPYLSSSRPSRSQTNPACL